MEVGHSCMRELEGLMGREKQDQDMGKEGQSPQGTWVPGEARGLFCLWIWGGDVASFLVVAAPGADCFLTRSPLGPTPRHLHQVPAQC